MRSILGGLVVVVSITACGNSGNTRVDGQINLTDSGNPPPPPGCDYGELHDATNDPSSAGTPEETLLTYTTGSMVICGSIDMTHFTPPTTVGDLGTIDADVYDISVAAENTEVRIDITGAGAEALDDVEVIVADTSGTGYGDGVFFTNHGVADVFFDVAGTYEITMFAGGATAPTSTTAIPYKIKLTPYDIESSCAMITTPATHTEGAGDNDVFAIAYPPDGPSMNGLFALTNKLTDAVEPSGITLATNNTSIVGSLVGTTPIDMDDYYDRDTFSFASGANVNEVTVRVDWADTTADLDMYMTPVIMPGTTNIPVVTSSGRTPAAPARRSTSRRFSRARRTGSGSEITPAARRQRATRSRSARRRSRRSSDQRA